jgi:hypothetical protein
MNDKLTLTNVNCFNRVEGQFLWAGQWPNNRELAALIAAKKKEILRLLIRPCLHSAFER